MKPIKAVSGIIKKCVALNKNMSKIIFVILIKYLLLISLVESQDSRLYKKIIAQPFQKNRFINKTLTNVGSMVKNTFLIRSSSAHFISIIIFKTDCGIACSLDKYCYSFKYFNNGSCHLGPLQQSSDSNLTTDDDICYQDSRVFEHSNGCPRKNFH